MAKNPVRHQSGNDDWKIKFKGAIGSRWLLEFVFNRRFIANGGGEKGYVLIKYGRIMTIATVALAILCFHR